MNFLIPSTSYVRLAISSAFRMVSKAAPRLLKCFISNSVIVNALRFVDDVNLLFFKLESSRKKRDQGFTEAP